MRKRPVCCACVFLMLCLCILDLAGIPVIRGNPLPREVREYIESHPSAVICGEVQRCQDTEYSLSVYLKQVFLLCQSERIPIRNIRVFLEKNAKENLKTGMVIQVGGELERVSAPRNPGEFDSQQYYACQGIYYFLKNGIIQKKGRNYSKYGQFLTELRGRIGEILLETAGEDAGIYQAMLLGEKSGLDEEVSDGGDGAYPGYFRTTHQRTRNGTVFVTQEAFIWQWMGRISFTECDPSVWDADRKQCVRNARCLHVCAGSRSADSGEKL